MTTEQPVWAAADFRDPPKTGGGVPLCGACRRQGECRLGVGSERLDGELASFSVTCPRSQEGGPNVAHGGWTAAVMDEVLGHLPLLLGQLTVTAELTVRFVKPVPVGRPLEARARIDRREGSRWYLGGDLVLASSGSVLARANGVWVARDPATHFRRHEAWLAGQEDLD